VQCGSDNSITRDQLELHLAVKIVDILTRGKKIGLEIAEGIIEEGFDKVSNFCLNDYFGKNP
jgi:hypothetical protein